MAFKLKGSTANTATKMYLWPLVYGGNGMTIWAYVTADAAATVDGSGYITAATNADHQQAVNDLKVGDLVLVWQAAAITDTQTIQADLAAGVTDFSVHMVLVNDGALIDMSNDLLGGVGGTFAGVLTYGD